MLKSAICYGIVICYSLLIILATYNIIRYLIGQGRYKEPRTGHKLVIFYILTLILCGVRIVLTIDLFEWLVLIDISIRFIMGVNYALCIGDLNRVLNVMSNAECVHCGE
jgi:hypothetical protein